MVVNRERRSTAEELAGSDGETAGAEKVMPSLASAQAADADGFVAVVGGSEMSSMAEMDGGRGLQRCKR
jgi:hypothetical protein